MKSIPSLLLALLTLGALPSPLLQAQEPANPSSPPAEERRQGRGPGDGPQGRGQMMNPQARVEQLDRELSLSADQKAKLTEVFTKARTEMEGLRGGGDGDRGANREKMQSIMQATRGDVQAVLTDDQKKKFKTMGPGPGRGERGEKGPRGDRPKGGGGPGKRKKDV